MASITISSPGGGVNPTNTFLPYNNNGVFADTFLQQTAPYNIIARLPNDDPDGLLIDNSNGSYKFGDFNSYFLSQYIELTEDGNANLNAQNLNITIVQPDGHIHIFNDNITSADAGLLSTYLKLSVNGNKYKIALLNDTL